LLFFLDLELLTFIEERIVCQEKENVAKSKAGGESPPVSPVNVKTIQPPVVLKKGLMPLAVKKKNKMANENQKLLDADAEDRHVSKVPMPDIIDIEEEIDNSESSQSIPSSLSSNSKPPSSVQSAKSLPAGNAASSIATHKLVGCSKLVAVDIPGAMLETEKTRSSRNLRSNITERKRKP